MLKTSLSSGRRAYSGHVQVEHVMIQGTLSEAHPGLFLLDFAYHHLREVAQQVGALGVELARLRVDAASAMSILTFSYRAGVALSAI